MPAITKKNTYQVLGVGISSYSKEDFYTLIEDRLKDNNPETPPLFIITVNPEITIQSIIDNEFREILNSSSINTADGIGISWAINFLYNKQIERITGSDSVEKICGCCSRCGQSVFLYGAAPGIARKAADVLTQKIEHLEIEGVYSPQSRDIPFENLPGPVKNSLKKASVIFVALGAPWQEKWINDNLHNFTGCKLVIGIGGSFDFIAGNKKRAPVFFQKSGLEWLYRLYLEPSRWRRMLRLPLFAVNVMLLKSSNGSNHHSGKVEISKEGQA